MPSVSGLYVDNKRVYQEIDLEDVTGVDFTGNEPLKLAIAQATVDYMRKRTDSGKDVFGKPFDAYSPSYKKSDEFEAYNKSSNVNMKLTGDMLASIDFNYEGNKVTFGFDESEEEVKAYGHMSGMKGHKFPAGKTPKRQFFGITKEDFEGEILPKFKDDLDFIKQQNSPQEDNEIVIPLDAFTRNTSRLNNSLDNFLNGLFDDEEF